MTVRRPRGTPRHPLVELVCAAALTVGVAACGSSTSDRTGSATGPLAGRIAVDGSSTVLPLSRALAQSFEQTTPGVNIEVTQSGTADGFRKLCSGSADLVGASRPINGAEARQCGSNRIDYIELPVAFDSVTVVANPANTFAGCLTVRELKTMWEPAAEGKIRQWNQIRASFPARPLKLFGPGRSSGTFDYFTLAVNGEEGRGRGDYTATEDDMASVNGIAADPDAIGYFGFEYYVANRERLKLIAIDSGRGCIVPSPAAVIDGSYQPLSRPVFVYVSLAAAARPEVKAFTRTYVNPDATAQVRALGYVPLPTATLLAMQRRLESGITGSIFKGHGSVLNVTAEMLQDEEKVKNALVR
jgi:phosphate transport system substrate-binding protein